MKASIYKNVWVRWIHSTWAHSQGWRTDVHQSVLDETSVTDALFVLDDNSCVFIPMDELRKILKDAPRPLRHGGRVAGPFTVNTQSESVNGISVNMKVLRPKARTAT